VHLVGFITRKFWVHNRNSFAWWIINLQHMNESITKCWNEYTIKLIIYISTIYLFIHKAICFDPSVGNLQAYIADQVTGAVCTLGSQYIYISEIHNIW